MNDIQYNLSWLLVDNEVQEKDPADIPNKEDEEKEKELIAKFGFTFDEEGQIILPEITEAHPLVEEQVEKVVAQAWTHEVEISPEMYCNVLEDAIRGVVQEHQTTGNPE